MGPFKVIVETLPKTIFHFPKEDNFDTALLFVKTFIKSQLLKINQVNC